MWTKPSASVVLLISLLVALTSAMSPAQNVNDTRLIEPAIPLLQRPPLDCPPILDDFNRPNGGLGLDWTGREGLGGYQIFNQQLTVIGGGPIYWRRAVFGADQAACIKLVKLDPTGAHQCLLFKVQGIWQRGAVAVFYDPTTKGIGVETFYPGRGWEKVTNVDIPFQDGDTLGVRVSFRIELFRNGVPRGEAPISLVPAVREFFSQRGGRIGLWYMDAPNAALDDFAATTMPP
ncbi:MAG: hypothetical protein HY868_03300 [Chloroflexi bacterium]|nr:hypothetical protein [Chloroflexota bacterium]